MDYDRIGVRLLLAVILANSLFAFASDPPEQKPIATLDVSDTIFRSRQEQIPVTIEFPDDNSIAIGPCAMPGYIKCSVTVVRWENAFLERLTQTSETPQDDGRSSGTGSRKLLDFNERRVSVMQHALETLRTITTLGMIGPEDVNREVIQVVDQSNGKLCFEWNRDFQMTYARPRSGAISPSGEFVAVIDGSQLAVYQVPRICSGRSISSTKQRPRSL